MNRATASLNERRLSRACQHVNQYWFPANKALLRRITIGLNDGVYDLDISFLIAELKTDLALLLYTSREALAILKADGKKIPAHSSLPQIFELAGLNNIKQIIANAEDRISSHDLEAISEEQALRMQEAIISASAAEVLSANHDIDGDLSFSCALVRQLGHILISWNYPNIYQRCLNAISPNKDLDQLLSEALGFSPKLLALALLNEWGLEGEIQEVLVGNIHADSDVSPDAKTLSKLCEIGEALARANDPEHYPSATLDWENVKSELEILPGENRIKEIQDKVKKTSENYLSLFPEMFQSSLNINPDTHLHHHNESLLLGNNQFVKHCPPRLRKKLKNFYTCLQPGSIGRESLALLLRDIIPFAGFSGGYVYTFDPSSGYLVPRTQIGRSVKKNMLPVLCSKENSSSDPVATAFSCNTPIVQNEGNDLSSIVGAIGTSNKIGVLYLETHPNDFEDSENNLLLHFKAIRQALNDCFQV